MGREAEPMAKQIINQGLTGLDEIWGSEVVLYYPDLYAGATDVVGIYNGRRKYNRLQTDQQAKTEENG